MPMMPPPGPPPPGMFGPEMEEEELARIKGREGAQNRRVVKWILKTARPFLPGILVLVVFSVVSSLMGIAFALLSQQTINSAVDKDVHRLVMFACALGGVGVAQIVIRALNDYWSERITARIDNGYRSRLFYAILDRDYRQVSSYHSGDLMNRITDDTGIIVSGVTSFLPRVAEIVSNLVGAGSVLLVMDWRFCIIYVFSVILVIVVNRIWRKANKRLSKEVREEDGKVRSYFQEAIESLLVLRVFVTEKRAKTTSNNLLNNYFRKRLERNSVRIKSSATIEFGMNFGHLFALIWCSFQLVWGNMTYGTLVAIMQLTGQVRMPFITASDLLTQYYSLIASGERLMEIEELQPELTEEERREVEEGFDARHLYSSMTQLSFQHVNFSYGRFPILKDVNLSIAKGETVAIMGHSGCGKSTLFKLVLGVFRDHEGTLCAEGVDGEGSPWSRELGPMTRRLFAYVPQGNFLISGKLRDNIAYADRPVTDEEIWEACRIACADEFLRKLPQGLNTVIGERGSGLSEGQTQRVAVARALLSEAPILLLDEATSALDEETEALMLRNIQQLKDRTCLIVTHRKAALSICDKVLNLQDAVDGPAGFGPSGPQEMDSTNTVPPSTRNFTSLPPKPKP